MRTRRVARQGALLSCLAGLVLGTAVQAQLPAVAADPPADQVTVSSGTVRGTVGTDRRSFLGIPYAAPPTGERRFRPPQPVAPWSGVRDATKGGNDCPGTGALAPNEDCLVLDVHTPPVSKGKNLPVMVWIHGGGYANGSANGYDPAPIVTKGDVIVVNVNYRLGVLGFLGLPGLKAEDQTTGNYGILDQQAGLRWVKQNIAAFGGNPNNVTIFGESAGGHSICMQLISPTAKGLFHKAIAQSSGCIPAGTGKRAGLGPVALNDAYTSGNAFATAVGCTDPATVTTCLRGKPVADILAKAGSAAGMTVGWRPVIDGATIRESTKAALNSGRYNKVPFVIGTNKDESRLFMALQIHLGKLRLANAADLEEWVRAEGGDLAPQLLARYQPASADNADAALGAAMTDSMFACGAHSTAQAADASQTQPVYRYEFSDPKPPLSDLDPLAPLGDYHAAELFYLFSKVHGIPFADLLLSESNRKLSTEMIRYWTTFAKTGNPNGGGSPNWPAGSGQVQKLTPEGSAPFAAATYSSNHRCDLWNQFGK